MEEEPLPSSRSDCGNKGPTRDTWGAPPPSRPPRGTAAPPTAGPLPTAEALAVPRNAPSSSLPSLASTPAPWATAGPASTPAPSPFTATARPGFTARSSNQNLTSAPWAAAGAGGAAAPPVPSMQRLTGQPVDAVISVEPAMPQPLDTAGPSGAPGGFQPPSKRLASEEGLRAFLASEAARDFMGFVLALNEAAKGHGRSAPCPVSPHVAALLEILTTLEGWVGEIPPLVQQMRYGNPAFRTWLARVAESARPLLQPLLPPAAHEGGAVEELVPYLCDSFGNATRIDYGTGHETTFCALLYCLARLGVFVEQDCQALVTRVFDRYLALMRRVQTTYWLEPAGSHGVWGLDDYQFLPFVWGSSQLSGHPMIRPRSISNDDVLTMYRDEFLYLGAILFVKQVKKGPLQETSPILCDISSVPSWAKVNSGMIKMYQVEVLSKLPIMQHFLFGSLLPFPPEAAAAQQQLPQQQQERRLHDESRESLQRLLLQGANGSGGSVTQEEEQQQQKQQQQQMQQQPEAGTAVTPATEAV